MAKLSEIVAQIQEAESAGDFETADSLRVRVENAGYGDRLPPRPEPVDEGFSFSNMVSNFPGSAKGVVEDAVTAIMNPIDTAKGLGQAFVGGMQHVQDIVPGPLKYAAPFAAANIANAMDEDYRPVGSAVAQDVTDAYGSPEKILTTLEEDPARVFSDAFGIVSGASPTLAARFNPVTRAASTIADTALKPVAESIMGSATKFSKTLPVDQVEGMNRFMLEEGINPSQRGLRKLDTIKNEQIDLVNEIIDDATVRGVVPASEVLDRLNDLKQQRGGSLISGQQDVAAIDRFIDQVVDNIQAQGKTVLDARDLQGMKTDLYRQINWNARSGTAETPALEDAQRALARGAKEEIETLAPRVKDENARLGQMLELEVPLERSARRIEDRNIFGMQDFLTLGGGALGGSAFGVPGLGLAVGAFTDLLTNPKISPSTAQGLYRVGKGLRSPTAQAMVGYPYLGAQFYYAGEAAAFEDELTGE